MAKDYWPDYMSRTTEYLYGEKPLFEYLREHARRRPGENALIFYGRTITWKELDESSDRFANFLLDRGVKKGDRIGLYLPNCPQFYIAYMGASKAGVIILPMNSGYREYELEHILTDTGAESLITMDYLYPIVANIKDNTRLKNIIVSAMSDYFPAEPAIKVSVRPETVKVDCSGCFEFRKIMEQYQPVAVNVPVDLEDIYNISFTSGTTGLPKGAMLTYRAGLYKAAVRYQVYFSKNPRKEHHRQLIDAPVPHIAGMVRVNIGIYGGLSTVLLLRYDLEEILQCIEKYRVTHWSTSTPGIQRLLDYPGIEKRDLSSLEDVKVNSYGITLTQEMSDEFRKLTGLPLSESAYGLTEDHTGSAFIPLEKIKYGPICTGLPVPDTQIKIIDMETKEEVGRNMIGEICVKSPAVFKGYWNNPEATREVLNDGWLHTGDLGKLDEDGYLWLTGRIKGMLKSFGFTVIPEEVESILLNHPAVQEVVVVGVPEEGIGDVVKAIIVPSEQAGGTTPEDIIEWCKGKMAGYKRPRYVEFRKELPRNNLGKLMRNVLAEEEKRKAARK